MPRSTTNVHDPHDHAPGVAEFRDDVVKGLTSPRKALPCKYLYDEVGSQLFEDICDVKEYYPTRTELSILEKSVAEMAKALGKNCLLIEYGSGSSRKTHLLLRALEEPAGYVPLDISSELLESSAEKLRTKFPGLPILPVVADYTADFELPQIARDASNRAVFFPGSTIGNFPPAEALEFLCHVAEVVGSKGGLLIGTDLVKDVAVLEAAYDDAGGVTANFNLNLLDRMNRELGTNFDRDAFAHRAFFNATESRIEMHLVSRKKQVVLLDEHEFDFERDETIWTESSYKFRLDGFEKLAHASGFDVVHRWTDDRDWFALQHLIAR